MERREVLNGLLILKDSKNKYLLLMHLKDLLLLSYWFEKLLTLQDEDSSQRAAVCRLNKRLCALRTLSSFHWRKGKISKGSVCPHICACVNHFGSESEVKLKLSVCPEKEQAILLAVWSFGYMLRPNSEYASTYHFVTASGWPFQWPKTILHT